MEAHLRHRHRSGLIRDVMPTDATVLGFSNRLYRGAVDRAGTVVLPTGRTARAVRPPWLVATKLDAFAGRGGGDPIASADFEDLVRPVDERPELAEEITAPPTELAAPRRRRSRRPRRGHERDAVAHVPPVRPHS